MFSINEKMDGGSSGIGSNMTISAHKKARDHSFFKFNTHNLIPFQHNNPPLPRLSKDGFVNAPLEHSEEEEEGKENGLNTSFEDQLIQLK
jgi:hypothetical protein